MSDRSWDRLSGLLIGASLGFIAGLLLAPDAGEETRNSVAKRAQGSLTQMRSTVVDASRTLASRSRSILRNGVSEIPLSDEQADLEPNGEPTA